MLIRSRAHILCLVSMHAYPRVKQLHLTLLRYFTPSSLRGGGAIPPFPFNLLHVWSKPATARILHQGRSYPLTTTSALNTYRTPNCLIGVGGLSFKVTCCHKFLPTLPFFTNQVTSYSLMCILATCDAWVNK